MKTTYFFLTLALSLVIIFTACQDDNVLVSEPIDPTTSVVNDTESETSTMMKANTNRISSSLILNASSYSKIPVYFYRENSDYKYSYQHLRQEKMDYCSWTSYVIAVGAIANKGSICRYDVSYSKVRYVRSVCISYGGSSSAGGRIDILQKYARNYDSKYISTYLCATSSQLTAVKEMLYHINTYAAPFIIVSSSNGIGHYRIIHSINWQGDPSKSTVYYTDCLLSDQGYFDGNIRSMNFNSFLSTMRVTAANYNMLFFMPK